MTVEAFVVVRCHWEVAATVRVLAASQGRPVERKATFPYFLIFVARLYLFMFGSAARTELKSGDVLAAALSNLDSQLRFAACVSCSGVQAVYFSTEH